MQMPNSRSDQPLFRKTRRRFDGLGDARELTFTCYRGFQFLARDRTRQWFAEELQKARETWPFDLWAYVIMPEHVHLLLYPREPNLDLGYIAGRIKEAVARKAIEYLEAHAPQWLHRITVKEGSRVRRRLWQPGGGYDRNVVEVATAHDMAIYIHANPVRRGLVALPEDWLWSSARWYAGIEPTLIEMDRTMPMRHETR